MAAQQPGADQVLPGVPVSAHLGMLLAGGVRGDRPRAGGSSLPMLSPITVLVAQGQRGGRSSRLACWELPALFGEQTAAEPWI